MLRSSLLLSIAVSASLACSASIVEGASPAPQDFQWTSTLAGPTRFELHDVNGAVRAEASSDDVLSVVATKTGRRADFDKVTIVARNDGGTVVVCALWPGQTSCPSAGSSIQHDKIDVRVDFVVRLPAKVARVDVETMNGALTMTNVNAKDGARLSTLNGRIDVVGSGPLDARTLNGTVNAQLTTKSAPVQLASHNGRVELTLPNDADADVEASTMRGTISNAFGEANLASHLGVPLRSRFKIGAGSARVGLHTMNGDVVVRRGS